MSIPRFPPASVTAALVVALLSFSDVAPAQAQDAGSADLWLSIGDRGSRMIGETEKNLPVDVLAEVTVHARTHEPLTVVLFVAQISGERVVARGETAPFRLDAGRASASRGVPLGRVLSMDHLRGVAPLKPTSTRSLLPLQAEFVVTGHALAKRPMNAADAVADPGPAFPLYDGVKLFVAVVPADPELRHRLTTQPLLFEVAVPAG
jgi:hypothetical protein